MTPNSSSSSESRDWFKDFSTIAAVIGGVSSAIAILVYIAGWSAVDEYLRFFGAGLYAVDVPGQFFFVYGFWMIWRNALWLFPLLGCLAGAALWGGKVLRRIKIAHSLAAAPVLALLAIAAAYWLGGNMGHNIIREAQANGFSNYPAVEGWLQPVASGQNKTLPDDVLQDLAAGCHRMLIQTKDAVFLVRPIAGVPNARPATLYMRADRFAALRLLPPRAPCP